MNSPAPKRRVMVVDDSLIIRGIMRRLITEDPHLELACLAVNGRQAIEQLRVNKSRIDVIILDIEMPVMDGLTALPELIKIAPDIPVIVASTLTLRNADISIQCLNKGAKDYIPKPETSSGTNSFEMFKGELIQKIIALTEDKVRKNPAASGPSVSPSMGLKEKPAGVAASASPYKLKPLFTKSPHAIVIGCSTGGPQALTEVMKNIKGRIKVPIFIAQHMPASFTAMLANHLSKSSGLVAKEGQDGDIVLNEHIYIAPGGYHMTVHNEGTQKVIRLNQEPPENFCRPSVNPTLRSAADAYGGRVLAAILTGMGSDGVQGATDLIEKGGSLIAQDEASSVVWGMPAAVAKAGLCSAILPLNQISRALERISNSVTPHLEKVS